MSKGDDDMKRNTVKDIYNYSDAQAVADLLKLGLMGAAVYGLVQFV